MHFCRPCFSNCNDLWEISTDLPLRSEINLDVGSAGGPVIEELRVLDKWRIGKSEKLLFDTLWRIADADNEVHILGGR